MNREDPTMRHRYFENMAERARFTRHLATSGRIASGPYVGADGRTVWWEDADPTHPADSGFADPIAYDLRQYMTAQYLGGRRVYP
jgi:hypothetical protein